MVIFIGIVGVTVTILVLAGMVMIIPLGSVRTGGSDAEGRALRRH